MTEQDRRTAQCAADYLNRLSAETEDPELRKALRLGASNYHSVAVSGVPVPSPVWKPHRQGHHLGDSPAAV